MSADRPPDHPLVELLYDVRQAFNRAAVAETARVRDRRVRDALRMARQLLDAVEFLLDNVDAQRSAEPQQHSTGGRADDTDFQMIQLR